MLFDRPRLIVARVHTPQRVVSQTRKLSGSYRTTPSPLIFEKKRNRMSVSERELLSSSCFSLSKARLAIDTVHKVLSQLLLISQNNSFANKPSDSEIRTYLLGV